MPTQQSSSGCGLWFTTGLAATVLFLSGCGAPDNDPKQFTMSVPATPKATTNVLTAHNDVERTGLNPSESLLTTSNVNSTSFGKLFSVSVDGRVDAQPLYVSKLKILGEFVSVIFAVTEHDSVYAIDASTGHIYWHTRVLARGETSAGDLGCDDIKPEVGVMATPVIDLAQGANGLIYLLSMSLDASGAYHHRLHALDLTTGAEQLNGPVEITASLPGTGSGTVNGQLVFNPAQQISRPGLLLLNGVIYTGWGSHCDQLPYSGWLLGYDQQTLKQTGAFDFSPNAYEASLWNSGAGLAADPAAGRIFASVANGGFDETRDDNDFPAAGDFGNAFVKLNPAGGQMVAEDYWTMDDTQMESAADNDLGSGGVVILPDLTTATGQTVQLALGGGKDGSFYVFNRQNMGKFNALSNGGIYQMLTGTVHHPVFSSPAYFNGSLYLNTVDDPIGAYPIKSALLAMQPASITSTNFGFPGTTPSISANGTSNGIVWAIENGTPEVLHAYSAVDLGIELFNSKQAPQNRDQLGLGPKFVVPTIADGKVIVGSLTSVTVFGIIN